MKYLIITLSILISLLIYSISNYNSISKVLGVETNKYVKNIDLKLDYTKNEVWKEFMDQLNAKSKDIKFIFSKNNKLLMKYKDEQTNSLQLEFPVKRDNMVFTQFMIEQNISKLNRGLYFMYHKIYEMKVLLLAIDKNYIHKIENKNYYKFSNLVKSYKKNQIYKKISKKCVKNILKIKKIYNRLNKKIFINSELINFYFSPDMAEIKLPDGQRLKCKTFYH